MPRAKLPPLGFCNVVVSRLDDQDTRVALGFEVDDGTKWECGASKDLVRRGKNQRWLSFEPYFGHKALHPNSIPGLFMDKLWRHRQPRPDWDAKDKSTTPTYGLVLHTAQLPVLDVVWAIRHVQEALAKDPKVAGLLCLRGGSVEQLARVRAYHKKIELLTQVFTLDSELPTASQLHGAVGVQKFCRWVVTKTFKTFYVDAQGVVKDISRLRIGIGEVGVGVDPDEASWGHLFDLSDVCGMVTRDCVNLYLDR